MVKGRVDPEAHLVGKTKTPATGVPAQAEMEETIVPTDNFEDVEVQEQEAEAETKAPPKPAKRPVKQVKGTTAPKVTQAEAPEPKQETLLDTIEDDDQGLDPESLRLLSFLLKQDGALSDKIADVIMEHYGRNEEMDNIGVPAGDDFFAPDVETEQQTTTAPAGIPPEVASRIDRLEQSYAQDALNRELAETVKDYETLRQQFPILPDLNEKEIMQIALDKGALPLSDAMTLWAMQQMRQGDGTPADRIIAATMAKNPGRNLPSPEGKGGVPPSGEAKPPESLKEAKGMARDRIRNLFGAGPG